MVNSKVCGQHKALGPSWGGSETPVVTAHGHVGRRREDAALLQEHEQVFPIKAIYSKCKHLKFDNPCFDGEQNAEFSVISQWENHRSLF